MLAVVRAADGDQTVCAIEVEHARNLLVPLDDRCDGLTGFRPNRGYLFFDLLVEEPAPAVLGGGFRSFTFFEPEPYPPLLLTATVFE